MGLTMKEKQAVTKQLALNYKRARKKEKGKILDTVIELTGCNRSYASRVLRERVKPRVLGKGRRGKVQITLVEDERTKRKKKQRRRPRKYDRDVVVAMRKVWVICDCICGKRLGPYLAEIVPLLERLDEPHCLTKKVLQTVSLPHLRNVLEIGGEVMVSLHTSMN